MVYVAAEERYEKMPYRYTGNSGLKLPMISLGLWNNFGDTDRYETQREIIHAAFDAGITQFDLANNYGVPGGSAERNFGRMLATDLKSYRDEMIVTSKAGYYMWPGPYGEWGSKKNIIASCNQSLQRLGLDYVDIFYHHRPDPNTPLEETAQALDLLVRQGKALYIGISNYNAEETAAISKVFKELGTLFIANQFKYNMFNREPEAGLLDVLQKEGLGGIVYSPLEQGVLTDRYLNGMPEDSRAKRDDIVFLSEDKVTPRIEKVKQLNELAKNRHQTLAEMALAWDLREPAITSVIIGASRVSQLQDNLKALNNLDFTNDELEEINRILLG